MSAAAVISMRMRKLARKFRNAGATKPEHAVKLEDLGESRSRMFDRMASRGVFRQTRGGRFYIDEGASQEYRRARRAMALRAVGLLFFVFLLKWGWDLFHQ